jgi:hypothetical protein
MIMSRRKSSAALQLIPHVTTVARKANQRVPILVDRLATLNRGSHEGRLASDAIIGFVRGSETLAAAAGEVDDELGRHEASDCAAELLFEG